MTASTISVGVPADVPDTDLSAVPVTSPLRHRAALVAAELRGLVANGGGRLRDALLTELFLKRSPY